MRCYLEPFIILSPTVNYSVASLDIVFKSFQMRVSPAISFSLLLVLCNWVSSSTSVHGIQWGQCAEEFEGNRTVNVTILCARLPVPLDYTNSSSKQVIELQLLRAPAVKQPSKGSILFNFGGPGQISRNDLVQRLDVHIPYVMFSAFHRGYD